MAQPPASLRRSGRARAALLAPGYALRQTKANPAVARLQLSWTAMIVATWAYTVGVTVYAFGEGGARAVAFAVVVRTLPSALAGGPIGTITDRHDRVRVMALAGAVAAVALAATAMIVGAGGPALPVYGLGLVVIAAGMAFRTAQAAVLPSVTDSPQELASANVVTSAIESAGVFAGPSLAAALLAVGDPTTVFVAAGLLFAAAPVAIIGMGRRAPARSSGGAAAAGTSLRGLAEDGTVRLVLGLLLAQTFVSGGLSVFYALCALDLLGLGASGVGLLTAAFGLGGVLGSVTAFAVAGTRRLVALLTAGLVLWGLPLALIGLAGDVVTAVTLLAAIGVGNVFFDVASVTLLQRAVPDAVLARVFGAVETIVVIGVGLGSLAAPLLTDALGLEAALVAFGLLLPALAVALRRELRRVDRSARIPELELGVLRSVPLLAGLPGPVLENLAFRSLQLRLAARSRVIAEGEIGDRFYAIAEGRLDVSIDGVHVRTMGPGEGFGEIALLRDVPRTATVVTQDDALLIALDREAFLDAVSGDPGASRGANAVVAARMRAGVLRRAS